MKAFSFLPLATHRRRSSAFVLETPPAQRVSEGTRREAGLTEAELWMRYFELGGMRTPTQVAAYLSNREAPTDHDHDVLAQALNERFSELGRDRLVRYSGRVR